MVQQLALQTLCLLCIACSAGTQTPVTGFTEHFPSPALMRFTLITGSLNIRYSFKQTAVLNESFRQPLSLSLSDRSRRDLPSWCPDWNNHTTRLVLNYLASDFTASPLRSDQYSMRSLQSHVDPSLIQPWILQGVVADVVSEMSTYCMPLRRHCDHYNVSGDNSAYFSFCLDFARDRAATTQSDDDLLLAFANTIQARGCGHVWDDVTGWAASLFGSHTQICRLSREPRCDRELCRAAILRGLLCLSRSKVWCDQRQAVLPCAGSYDRG